MLKNCNELVKEVMEMHDEWIEALNKSMKFKPYSILNSFLGLQLLKNSLAQQMNWNVQYYFNICMYNGTCVEPKFVNLLD